MERDVKGLAYAVRNNCHYLFVDMDTGKIWQFGLGVDSVRNWDELNAIPHMSNCKKMPIGEYKRLTRKNRNNV